MLPTRLLSAQAWYTAPLRLPVSILLRRVPGAARVPTGTGGDPPPPRSRVANRTGRGSRSCRHGPPVGPPAGTPLAASHAPEAALHLGDVFLCPLWLSESLSPLPERKAGFRLAPSHLAGTLNMPQGSSQNCQEPSGLLRLLRHSCAT